MNKTVGRLAVILSAMAPFLCGGSLPSAAPPNGGTIAIASRTADGEYDPSLNAFVEAASATLVAHGFTILDDPAHAAFLGELTLDRATVGTGLGKDPNGESIGIAGAGVVVPMSTGKSSVVTLQRTKLALRIRRREGGSVVWNGAAVTVRGSGTRKGAIPTAASDLSEAILHDYPAEPRDIVGVP